MSAGDGAPAFAEVALPVPPRRTFVYAVPPALAGRLEAGARVRVPLGTRRLRGTVVGSAGAPEGVEVREVEALLEDEPRLSPEILELTRFAADYYLCSWGEAIGAALPPDAAAAPVRRFARRLPASAALDLRRAPARARALAALPEDGSWAPASSSEALRALVAAGAAEVVAREDEAPRPAPLPAPERGPQPTTEQAAALIAVERALDAGGFAPFVLFGATGSGKTEVYLRAAASALARGRTVLWLVPEIGLTPLLTGLVERRFPGQVAVLHSGLPDRDRRAAWEAVRRGERRVVVGTRSAVFAPLDRPGLIVVDEEHDGSYKQGETPRYHGRDLAVVRARAAGAVLLLGSATPSLESFTNARAGRYGLIRLGGRVESRPLARVQVVDMRREYRDAGEVRVLSADLVAALRECLDRGEQALVLRNRRGWAPSLLCPACGERVSCARCSLSMTWHRAAARLRCHACDLERRRPERCPSCGGDELRLLGEGTERVEHELREALPAARLARMDRDTVRRAGEHARLLREFAARRLDVLVGTQMIAKGHDFPGVTLVGVLSADASLGLPDFRAAERTFQLLTQVAGRAGRGERPGRVVVQAFDPDHPVLREAAAQDFEAFHDREIRYRRALRYPPLAALVNLVVADRDPERAAAWAGVLGRALRAEGQGKLIVSGPGPAPIERLRALWRRQILVRSAGRRRLVEAVGRAMAAVEREVPRRAITVDVDPVSLM